MQWWQTRDLVLIPIAAILGFALIVGVQGREIKALKGRVSDLEQALKEQQHALAPLYDDYVDRWSRKHIEPQDCEPFRDDPASATLVVCGKGPARVP